MMRARWVGTAAAATLILAAFPAGACPDGVAPFGLTLGMARPAALAQADAALGGTLPMIEGGNGVNRGRLERDGYSESAIFYFWPLSDPLSTNAEASPPETRRLGVAVWFFEYPDEATTEMRERRAAFEALVSGLAEEPSERVPFFGDPAAAAYYFDAVDGGWRQVSDCGNATALFSRPRNTLEAFQVLEADPLAAAAMQPCGCVVVIGASANRSPYYFVGDFLAAFGGPAGTTE